MGRLRHTANAQAAAEYDPQKRRARREAGSQIRSIRSMTGPLTDSLETASNFLGHAGLNPQDLRIARSEFAHRIADVGASAALQEGQVRQDTRQQLVDLSEAEGQAARAALASLQSAAQEHRQSIHDAIAGEDRGIATAIKQKLLEQKLGLDDGSSSDNGLTPTQHRAQHQEHLNAAYYAKELFQALKGGAADKEGNPIAGAHYSDPSKWDEKTWNAITSSIVKRDGVDNISQAQRAVSAIRDHVQPRNDLMHALGVVAQSAAPAIAANGPKGLRPILQFGASLAR